MMFCRMSSGVFHPHPCFFSSAAGSADRAPSGARGAPQPPSGPPPRQEYSRTGIPLNRRRTIQLPPDFLRVRRRSAAVNNTPKAKLQVPGERMGIGRTSTSASQLAQDEAIAQMYQQGFIMDEEDEEDDGYLEECEFIARVAGTS